MALPELPDGFHYEVVKVDPSSGYLYAAMPDVEFDVQATIVGWLENIDGEELEDALLSDPETASMAVGEGILTLLKRRATGAG